MHRISIFVLVAGAAFAQRFTISTLAGGPPGWLQPVSGLQAAIGQPEAVVADSGGNLYISSSTHSVSKLDSKGILTHIAGNGHAGFSGDGGPAAQAALNFESADINGFAGGALAIDKAGNLYIADSGNRRIRKVTPDGSIRTIAGTGDWGDRGDGGSAIQAHLGSVSGIAADGAGNLYIADHGYRDRVRVITPDGTIETIPASASLGLTDMAGLTTDQAGNLYVADFGGNRVLEVTAAGAVQTIAGSGTAGFAGDGGPATSAELRAPLGLAVDPEGSIYIADAGNARIRQVKPDGTVQTVAGGGKNFGQYNGDATSAALFFPYAVTIDAAGGLVIADTWQNLVRRVSGGAIATMAGNASCCDAGDGGPAAGAQFSFSLPSGSTTWGGALATDNSGNLYVADTANLQIRMISPAGIVSRVAGTGKTNEDGGNGGLAVDATINYPSGLAVDNAGDLYISDGVIRVVGPNGVIETAAAVTLPFLDAARAVTVDAAGNLYFGSFGGVQKVAADGQYSLVTKQVGWSMAADQSGNLFAGDINGMVVRRIAPDGAVTVVAGTGTPGFSGDGGPANAAQISPPAALAVDAAGNLYIADCFNQRIRMVTPDGTIKTIAGNGQQGYSGDGGDALKAEFGLISGMAVDRNGILYLADQTYNVIRLVRQAN